MVGIITIFLSVLITALAIGNGMLYFISPKKQEVAETTSVSEVVEAEFHADKNLLPVEKKVELAHKRIQRLEKILAASKETKSNLALKRKVDKLDNFRSTIESEIIGIKEILVEIQNNGYTIKSRSFKGAGKKKARKLSPKQLHKMVYRSTA